MNKKKINECLDRVITLLVQIKRFLLEIPITKVDDPLDVKPEFLNLIDEWPEAVPSNAIVDRDDEIAKCMRARSILDNLIEEDLTELRFLDFGCGSGHTVFCANEKNVFSVGYDIRRSSSWDTFTNRDDFLLTTNWDEVLRHSPYDVILCFDVIDHLEQIEPISMLNQISEVLKNDGKLYLRTHPWISRHAEHTYHEFNKAFSHLILTDEEIREYIPDYSPLPNIRVQYPLKTYANYFQQTNFKVLSNREVKRELEPFFKREDVKNRVIRKAQVKEFPEDHMSFEFIDYVLVKS